MTTRWTRRGVLGGMMLGAAGVLTACAQGIGPDTGAQDSATGGTSGGDGTDTGADDTTSPTPTAAPTTATAAEMATRAIVPVLCYHQVRPHESGDDQYSRGVLIAEPGPFGEQLDAIADAGYTTIGPEDYLEYLRTGTPLPDKPVLLSFDDGKDNQATTALPAVLDRGMTATWYIMTVVVGNSGWTTGEQIRELADAGITIGAHTWDHHDVREYSGEDWTTQFVEPRERLQELSGQEVTSFAYPFGAWKPEALPQLSEAGYTTAFQLDDKPLHEERPELTLRRALAVSAWSGDDVLAKLEELARPDA